MPRKAAKFLVLVACSVFLVARALQQPELADETLTCISRERDALLAFKQGVTNDTQNILASWQQGHDCCRWRGVTCSNNSGHVIKLDLHGRPDISYFPFVPNQAFFGQISPSLFSLEYLEYLDLSWSFQLGGPNHSIPEFLGSMKNLKHLGLSGMSLTGQLPSFLGNLSRLEYLDLSYQRLEGPNCNVPEFLSSMKNMKHLDLSEMPLCGGVPYLLGNLSKLEYLDLSGTYLVGTLPPQLGNLSNLQYLGLRFMPNLNPTDISWLKELHFLEYINLSYTNLCKIVDLPSVVNMIPTLKHIFLANCSLSSAKKPLSPLNLTSGLEEVDLSYNYLNHPVSCCWFWNLTSIVGLYLSETHLYGPFPDALGRMTSLQRLDFTGNGNAATIAVDLNDLCALESLRLDGSLSSGNITEFAENLSRCPSNKLQELSLMDNNMTGILPDMFPSLVYLYLSNNSITGFISFETGNCSNLSLLDLSSNLLTGIIPIVIGNYTRLSKLDLSNNFLTGPIQSVIGNNFPFPSLYYLDLSTNHLCGAIPLAIGNSTSLVYVILHSNQLTGPLPTLPINLIIVDASMNLLSGPLPSDFGASDIEVVILFSNNLSGRIPEHICDLRKLHVLDLSNNFLQENVPICFQMSKLVFLFLSNNMLSGEFPPSFQNCSRLAFIDLAWNSFYGELPLWIGDLGTLQFLWLSHNMFNGNIPVSIKNLKRLRHLNLARNYISGAIPRFLSNLTAMTTKHVILEKGNVDMAKRFSQWVGKFEEVITVVMKQQELKYGAEIFELVSIDLSVNHITGEIPDEITSLNGLMNLNLSWNQLSGKIPEKIGAMQSVESLDLSRNYLYGEIPSGVSKLTYLCTMDLSYNNLEGTIPQGRQLDTLYMENPTMYKGNNGLCGPPLPNNCSGSNKVPESDNQNTSAKYPEAMFFCFGLGSGFVAGLWAVFCTMLFKKAWRISCFRLVDRVYDKVYVFVKVTCSRLGREATTG